MRALVTGATGFTGMAVAKRLAAEGVQVTAFVRDPEKTEELQALGVHCRNVDITDDSQVNEAFERFDRVFHIAALYRTEDDIERFNDVNVEGTRHMLEASRKFGVGRFIHCSTVGVHGRIEDRPANESYRFHPEDHYQRSKLAGELLASEYFASGLPGVIVRPAGIYGPGDLRFLKVFKAIERGWFVLIGNGQTRYHFTYIDDLVDGMMLAATRPVPRGEVFSICSAQHTTVGQFVEDVAKALDRPAPKLRVPAWPVKAAAIACVALCRPFGIQPPLYPRRLEFFTMDRAFTIEKAQRVLGYQPKVNMSDGVARTALWYRANNLLSFFLPLMVFS